MLWFSVVNDMMENIELTVVVAKHVLSHFGSSLWPGPEALIFGDRIPRNVKNVPQFLEVFPYKYFSYIQYDTIERESYEYIKQFVFI